LNGSDPIPLLGAGEFITSGYSGSANDRGKCGTLGVV